MSEDKFIRLFLRACAQVILVAVCLGGLATSVSAGSRGFEALKAEYLLLRNRDPHVKDPSNWRTLVRKLETGEQRLPRAEGDQALFMAATLLGEIVRSSHDAKDSAQKRGDLAHALRILRDVSGRGGEYADDSLARAIELFDFTDNPDAAEQVIAELKHRFPGSEFAPLYSNRRNRSDPGTSRNSTEAKIYDVVLDPGHGGDDLGAQGYAGLLEKDVTLSVANLTKEALSRRGISATLTRQGDSFLPLSARTQIANKAKAKLFISIHANASVRATNRGVETYVLDGDQSGNTKLLVQRENGSEASDLAFLLGDVIQREKRPEAIKLATVLQRRIVLKLRESGYPTEDLGVKKGPFFVLVGSHMPGALVELGFIDHPEEGRLIGTDTYRQMVAEAIASGIAEVLNAQPNSRLSDQAERGDMG